MVNKLSTKNIDHNNLCYFKAICVFYGFSESLAPFLYWTGYYSENIGNVLHINMNLKTKMAIADKWGVGVKRVSQAITLFEKMNPALVTKPITRIVQGMYSLHSNIFGDIIWDKDTAIIGITMSSQGGLVKSIRIKYKYS